jgi:repressor LexA
MKLTQRQKEILDFISGFIERNGYSPSMEEIAEHFQFASLNAVFKHLEALASRGYLHRDSNRARSIQLSASSSTGVQNLPLFGYVAAGRPIEAVSVSETLQCRIFMCGAAAVLQGKGESAVEDTSG